MKRQCLSAFALFAATTLAVMTVHAAPMVFQFAGDPKDVLTFTSKASLEKIDGRTNKITGEVMVENLNDLAKGKAKATFEVDLASLKTGIELRDQHLREQYLETEKFPKAVFTLTKIESVQVVEKDKQGDNHARAVKGLQPGVATRLIASGTFELHGKKLPVRISNLTVTYVPESDQTKMVRKGHLLAIDGGFRVKLTDYGIKRPEFLALRVADEINVAVNVVGGTGEEMVADACDGKCGGKKCGGKCGGKTCGGKKCGEKK